MGVSHSFGELGGKLTRLAGEYAELPNTLAPEAAQIAKRSVLAVSPSRLRGVGKKGANLSVAYNVSHSGGSAQALVFAKGPWQLIEGDTKAHQIPRQRSSASFEGVFGHAVIPGGAEGGVHGKGGVRTRVMHPGTHGKHPFRKGIEAARPLITRMFDTQGAFVLNRIF